MLSVEISDGGQVALGAVATVIAPLGDRAPGMGIVHCVHGGAGIPFKDCVVFVAGQGTAESVIDSTVGVTQVRAIVYGTDVRVQGGFGDVVPLPVFCARGGLESQFRFAVQIEIVGGDLCEMGTGRDVDAQIHPPETAAVQFIGIDVNIPGMPADFTAVE